MQVIHTYRLNPKCIKMGELYGEYNLLTNAWTDGLASTIIRAAVGDTSLDRKWVVFDGPVDAVWIENMNTGELALHSPPCIVPAPACTCISE
jgi:dynein heavy chain